MATRTEASPQRDPGRPSYWAYLLIVAILLIASLARFYLLRTTPGWYADEGSDIEIATHLLAGEQQYFAIGQSTLVAGRLPLFHLILAGLFSILGRDIWVLRLLTTTYGLLIVLLLFWWGRRMWGDRVALLAALLYAIYPNAVLYSRFGFMYNQIALLNLVFFYMLWRFIWGGASWWLVAACLAGGLSLITNASTLPLIGFLILALFFTRRSALWWAVPLMLGLPTLYAMWMMIQAPQAFLADLSFIFLRVGGHGLFRIFFIVWNYKELLLWDAWFPLAAFGLTRLPARGRSRLYTQAYFWYFLLAVVGGVSMVRLLGYHYVVPLLPWTSVGMAAFLVWAFPRLLAELERIYNLLFDRLPRLGSLDKWYGKVRRPGQVLVVGLLLFWIFISPFIAMLVQAYLVPGRTFPEMEQVTVREIPEAEAAVAYVNQRVGPDELVLAPPHVAWLVNSRRADYQQAAACAGGGAINYPEDLDTGRFLFDCSVRKASYVLIWAGWRAWTAQRMPDVEDIYLTMETWPVVFEQGEWRVYANPELRTASP